MKKILLIVPPVILRSKRSNFNINFPMGLGYLAAVLENASCEVVVLDSLVEKFGQKTPVEGRRGFFRFGMTYNEIRQFVSQCNPDCVGVTSMFTKQFENTVLVCDAVKEAKPDIPVIVGGAHASAAPEKVIENESIDYVVVGEGEEIILPLLNAIGNKSGVGSIPNVCYINEEGEKVIKPVTVYSNVNHLPFPARHLFPIEKYISSGERHGGRLEKGVRSLSILTSRGCPFNCNFCSAYNVFGKKLRCRSANSVLDEIDEMVNLYRVNDIYLTDDQFLAGQKRVIEILEGIASRDYQLTLDAPNGLSPWMLNEEILMKMKKAGFLRIPLAIESGNEWVLKNIINKPVKLDMLPDLVSMARKHKLQVSAFLVVGNVSENAIETFDQMEDSFDLIRKLGIRYPTVSYLSPHIGSTAYDVVTRRGYIDKTYKDDDYDKPCISTPLWSSAKLERFILVQRLLCVIEGKVLLLPIKWFVQHWGGIMLKERYFVMYNFILLMKRLKSFFR